jgi:2-oxoisovalerate dehydrogenase E1 component
MESTTTAVKGNEIERGLEERYFKGFVAALVTRAFELETLRRFARGDVRGTVHTSIGQELVPAILCTLIVPGDMIFGTHRSHGYYLALGYEPSALAAEILSREGAVSHGLGGSQHIWGPQLITNGVQGGLIPAAVGYGTSDSGVAISVIGDGTLGQGVLYESLNIAALHSSRTLFLLEDNGIAQSTPTASVVAGSITGRFQAFGIPVLASTSADPANLAEQISNALAFARSTGPVALHLKVSRLGSHSKGDDNRAREEIQRLWSQDFLSRAIAEDKDVNIRYEELVHEFEKSFDQVLSRPTARCLIERTSWDDLERNCNSVDTLPTSDRPIVEQLRRAIRYAMRVDARLHMLGEDVETQPVGTELPYPGAFGVSSGLSSDFPGRVINFPISEQALVGFAIGRALAGEPTIVEIMFGDFTTLIVDQFRQQASKISAMYGSRVSMPIVIRTPMGGRRGYGPTHSQNYEGLFVGTPNAQIYEVSPYGVPEQVFLRLLETGIVTLFVEHKDLYNSVPPRLPIGYELETLPIGYGGSVSVRCKDVQPQATVLTYGHAARLVIESLEDLLMECEVSIDAFVFERIWPLDLEVLLPSIRKTGRLVIVEEPQGAEGLGGAVLVALERQGLGGFPLHVIGGHGDVGASAWAEHQALISREEIVESLQNICRSKI